MQEWIDHNSETKEGGGGLCIYIKSQHNFEIIPLQMCNVDKDIEALHVRIKPPNQKPIEVVAVYRPPDRTEKEFTKTLSKIISQ